MSHTERVKHKLGTSCDPVKFIVYYHNILYHTSSQLLDYIAVHHLGDIAIMAFGGN